MGTSQLSIQPDHNFGVLPGLTKKTEKFTGARSRGWCWCTSPADSGVTLKAQQSPALRGCSQLPTGDNAPAKASPGAAAAQGQRLWVTPRVRTASISGRGRGCSAPSSSCPSAQPPGPGPRGCRSAGGAARGCRDTRARGSHQSHQGNSRGLSKPCPENLTRNAG